MRRILLVCCLLLTLMVAPINAQNDEEPPYLFYYSRILGGLVIERADGTDSRLIAADVIPPGYAGISGAGWSPSGRYFAALPSHSVGAYQRPDVSRPIVVDLNGNEVAQSLQWTLTGSTGFMEWSPHDHDLLLIWTHYRQTYQRNDAVGLWLYDIAADELLVDFIIRSGFSSYWRSPIQWDEENEQIVFYVSPDTEFSDQYKVTMRFDGTTLREPVDYETFREYAPPFIPPDGWDRYDGRGTSPSGIYSVEGVRPTILTHTRTSETRELPTHSQGTNCRVYLWGPDENYLITLNGTLVAGGGCAGAVMGVTDVEGELWRELGGCLWTQQVCVGWLPEQVDVTSLPSGNNQPVLLEPVRIDESEIRYAPEFLVEPDTPRLQCTEGQTDAIVQGENDAILYDLAALSCSYNADYRYADEGAYLIYAYNETYDLLATYYADSLEEYVSIWTRRNGVYERVLRLNTYGYDLEFTDDGEYLRARNVNGWKVYAVEDISSRLEG